MKTKQQKQQNKSKWNAKRNLVIAKNKRRNNKKKKKKERTRQRKKHKALVICRCKKMMVVRDGQIIINKSINTYNQQQEETVYRIWGATHAEKYFGPNSRWQDPNNQITTHLFTSSRRHDVGPGPAAVVSTTARARSISIHEAGSIYPSKYILFYSSAKALHINTAKYGYRRPSSAAHSNTSASCAPVV